MFRAGLAQLFRTVFRNNGIKSSNQPKELRQRYQWRSKLSAFAPSHKLDILCFIGYHFTHLATFVISGDAPRASISAYRCDTTMLFWENVYVYCLLFVMSVFRVVYRPLISSSAEISSAKRIATCLVNFFTGHYDFLNGLFSLKSLSLKVRVPL
jgi:hypothetical protein